MLKSSVAERASKRVLPKFGDEPSNLEALALVMQLLQRGQPFLQHLYC